MTFYSLYLFQAANGNAGMIQILFFGAMLLIFWFFLIRPQAKRQREQREFMDGLDKNMEVVTGSGIIGRISKIEGDVVTLDAGNKVYLRITKNAISKEMTDALVKTANAN